MSWLDTEKITVQYQFATVRIKIVPKISHLFLLPLGLSVKYKMDDRPVC